MREKGSIPHVSPKGARALPKNNEGGGGGGGTKEVVFAVRVRVPA